MERGEGRVDRERGRTCGWRDRKDVVLIMVLIETVLTLLLMIEQLPECKATTAMSMAITKQQSHTIWVLQRNADW